mgnify:CR=1 FL=1
MREVDADAFPGLELVDVEADGLVAGHFVMKFFAFAVLSAEGSVTAVCLEVDLVALDGVHANAADGEWLAVVWVEVEVDWVAVDFACWDGGCDEAVCTQGLYVQS